MAAARRIGLRLAILVASLLCASLIVFLICQALPGDVAQTILGTNASADDVARLRAELGLDRPLAVRYLAWLGGMLTGDFGLSATAKVGVTELMTPTIAVTFWLVALGMVFALLVAVPLGMYSAVKRRHWQGLVASSLSQLGMAVPAFFAGVLLVVAFAIKLRWLPANGYVDIADDPLQWARHLVLPVASLALVQGAILSRYVRTATVDVLGEDWFRTARAVGSRLWPALWRHGLRNIATSLVTVVGLQLATLLVGAIVIEQVFQLPGLGQLLLVMVQRRDLVVVQGVVMLLVASVLVINFVVEAAYVAIDPRLRTGDRS